MAGDWIKLHRKAKDSQVFSDPEAWFLFCWLLISVNWKDGFFLGTRIPTGSIATSIAHLAERLECSPSKIKRLLRKLENYGSIVRKSTNRHTLITLVNWGTYQDDAEDQQQTDEPTTGQRANQRVTHNRRREEGEEEEAGASAPASDVKPSWSPDGGFANVKRMIAGWRDAYPDVDVEGELARMQEWLQANPAKASRKKQWGRFIMSWLGRTQKDNAPPTWRTPKTSTREEIVEVLREGSG